MVSITWLRVFSLSVSNIETSCSFSLEKFVRFFVHQIFYNFKWRSNVAWLKVRWLLKLYILSSIGATRAESVLCCLYLSFHTSLLPLNDVSSSIFSHHPLIILITFLHLNWMRVFVEGPNDLFSLLAVSTSCHEPKSQLVLLHHVMTVSALIMLRKTFVRGCLSPLWSSRLTRCHVRTHPKGLSSSWMLSRQDDRGLQG